MSHLINAFNPEAIATLFITNLGKYTEGELVGEWIDFPTTKAEINALLERIGIDGIQYEEYFITDFKSDLLEYPGEYFNIFNFNDTCQKIKDSGTDPEIICALMGESYDLDEIINGRVDFIYWQAESMYHLAHVVVEEYGLLDRMPADLRDFFNYEAYANHLETTCELISTKHGYIEIL